MSSTEITARLDALTAAVSTMARMVGARLTRAEVCERLGVHRKTLTKLMATGEAPTPMRDGKWSLAEILGWECRRFREPAAHEPEPIALTEGAHHLYRHFDDGGSLLYVGVSIAALNRLASHREAAHWYARIARVEVTAYASRIQALAAEKLAIKREKPLHNIMHARRRG